ECGEAAKEQTTYEASGHPAEPSRRKKFMGISPEQQGYPTQSPRTDQPEMGPVLITEQEDRVWLPLNHVFDKVRVVESIKMVCSGITALIRHKLVFVTIQERNVP